jgi:N-acetylglucosamine malate deacetylase 1
MLMTEDSTNVWDARYSRWLEYVVEFAKAAESGAKISPGPSSTPLILPMVSTPAAGAPKILICSPHPDDEALIGALPLRLRREAGARVVNCAITLGNNASLKERRLGELESACRVLGFRLVVPDTPAGPLGFDRVNPETRQENPQEWTAKVEALVEIFDRERPDAIFAPHAEDFNTTHMGTHLLVTDALRAHFERTPSRNVLPLIETEYWHQIFAPNLMVGVTPETVAVQLMATAEHGGEVSRNPYHLRQAARMMDNVRRGSEVVGGQGGPSQPFAFAELYRVTLAQDKGIVEPHAPGLMIRPRQKMNWAALLAHFGAETR